ncbi:MAG: hypothetical protein OSB70_06245 [Myxococcota bacterium]|nr:hypothetical protein [Myxococcota bacterium]
MKYFPGDRVRIRRVESEYAGSRGVVAETQATGQGDASPLGCFVAIDGENGRVRPFLIADLELLRAASVRRTDSGQNVNPEHQIG